MPRIKATFENHSGDTLAGLLEMPEHTPAAYALFAHCFTCSKDIAAASRISRSLANQGVAVLRFDFTGLGNSDGDFANTNFSSNLQDLLAAAQYLQARHAAPALLIGHSLGGAAILAAARSIPSARAVVAIGAPATAEHVLHLFADSKDAILAENAALVELAGRQFAIKRQLLDDLALYNDTAHIARLDKALLLFHSPLDATVSIDEAARIYAAARHPKSFISLDKADHLLSRREDSEYVAAVIAAWAGRYLDLQPVTSEIMPGTKADVPAGQVLVRERDRKFSRQIDTEHHQLLADEPLDMGGTNRGPNPYEYLLSALGACTSMTIRMYANRKGLKLDDVAITLDHSRVHADDCGECESKTGFVDQIEKSIRLRGALSAAERRRLLEIADRCPVHKTLKNEILIQPRLVEECGQT